MALSTKENSDLEPSQGVDDVRSSEEEEDQYSYPADAFSKPRQILLIATVCMSMFTNQLGLGNLLTTLKMIGDDFGISTPGQLSWLIAGYSSTIGTFILISGRLGDEFGNKRMFVLGMSWLSLWSMVAGLAVYSNHVLFIFARVLQGIGPAMVLPNALAIFAKSFSERPRNMAFSWFAATSPYGSVAGLVFGPLFAMAWWPWIFWSQAIGVAFVAAFAAWTIPNIHDEVEQKPPLRERLNHLDLPGGAAGVLTLILFNFAWNQAAVVTWKEPYVYVCLILSFIFGSLFFYIEIYRARYPILPVSAFNVDIALVFVCTAAGWGTFGIWCFYVVRVCLDEGGQTPIQMAAWFSPCLITAPISALAVGRLINRATAPYIMFIGQIAFLTTNILMALRPAHSIYWTYFFFAVIIATIGMDSSLPAASIIFANTVPRQYQGMGASIVMTIVNYSISLGLGFAGTIEININRGGKNDSDLLYGYRGALWFSVGLTGLGTVLSLIFLFRNRGNQERIEHKSEGEVPEKLHS